MQLTPKNCSVVSEPLVIQLSLQHYHWYAAILDSPSPECR